MTAQRWVQLERAHKKFAKRCVLEKEGEIKQSLSLRPQMFAADRHSICLAAAYLSLRTPQIRPATSFSDDPFSLATIIIIVKLNTRLYELLRKDSASTIVLSIFISR